MFLKSVRAPNEIVLKTVFSRQKCWMAKKRLLLGGQDSRSARFGGNPHFSKGCGKLCSSRPAGPHGLLFGRNAEDLLTF
jgi:hypothetical protein